MARTLAESELLALADTLASGDWASGEALASSAGITRAGLAKRISHLRNWGLEIESQQGLGYRLASPLERLDESFLQSSLDVTTGLTVLGSTASTNAVAMELDPEQDPHFVLAEHQTAGRGRRGRQWQSPFGSNLYLSVAWSWPAWPPDLPCLSLATGVMCARALTAVSLENVKLKWPNDLWADGKKIGGILIEQRGEFGGACRVVVGVGINVSMQSTQASQIDQPWTTVNDRLVALDRAPARRNDIAAELVRQLQSGLREFGEQGFQRFRDQWTSLDALRDAPVHVPDDPTLTGVGRGIDSQGAFILETSKGRQTLHAGDVSLRPAPET